MKRTLAFFLSRHAATENTVASAALLFLRIGIGLMMAFGHGWGKLSGFTERSAHFSDPYGMGPVVSMALAVFAEFFCSLGLVLGLLTRAAVIPLMVTMLTAVLIVHAGDPWSRKELALMYLIPLITIMIAGPGKYSLDRILWRRG